MFPSAQQLVLSSVSAKTCTVAGWDLVREIGVCCPSRPSLLPRKQEKVAAGFVPRLCLSITFMAVLSPSHCSGCHYMLHMQITEEMEICFQLCEQLHHASELSTAEEGECSGTPDQTSSDLCLPVVKVEIWQAEKPHPAAGFSCLSEESGKVAAKTERGANQSFCRAPSGNLCCVSFIIPSASIARVQS